MMSMLPIITIVREANNDFKIYGKCALNNDFKINERKQCICTFTNNESKTHQYQTWQSFNKSSHKSNISAFIHSKLR